MEKISVFADKFEYFTSKDKKEVYIKANTGISGKGVEVDSSKQPLKLQSLNELRDEYHSIGELYEFRKAYNALLFNTWAKYEGWNGQVIPQYDVHKSWKHYDEELCFGGGWFIVVAILPTGQITNHYKAEDWDLFQIPAVEKAKYEYDGHTPADTLERMKQLLKNG